MTITATSKCANCAAELINQNSIEVFERDTCPTDRGDEVREGWVAYCVDCYNDLYPTVEDL